LKKEEKIPYYDVIDGNQRLTTLTFFSEIAPHLSQMPDRKGVMSGMKV